MNNIDYHGHKMRKLPKLEIVRRIKLTDEYRRSIRRIYDPLTCETIINMFPAIPGAFHLGTIILATNNIYNRYQFVELIIHEFTHALQHRFGVKYKSDVEPYSHDTTPSEIEARLFETKYARKIYKLYENAVERKFLNETHPVYVRAQISSRQG